MSTSIAFPSGGSLPGNLCELFLRDLLLLLNTSRTVVTSLVELQPQCSFSPDLQDKVAAIITVSRAGEAHLDEPLREGGLVVPSGVATGLNPIVTNFFSRIPIGAAPGVIASEVVASLRLLAQHIELRTRLAAEKAIVVGQRALSRALFAWAAEWRRCSRELRAATVQTLMMAYVADVPELLPPRPEDGDVRGKPFREH